MKTKVKKIVNDIMNIIRDWGGARAVVLQHFVEKDVYDANFSITLDVFRDGEIPDRDTRAKLFSDAEYFESSPVNKKDRFILQDMPVRISYKDCGRVENVLAATGNERWIHMEGGTYLFNRIATGTVVWSRDEWINTIVEQLDQLPDNFWRSWIVFCYNRIDHSLNNMGAAVIKEDPLYFLMAHSAFMYSIADILFAFNHVFAPSPRDYSASLALLELLPEGFDANWLSLLRSDSELPPERKHEIARILARSVFDLKPDYCSI